MGFTALDVQQIPLLTVETMHASHVKLQRHLLCLGHTMLVKLGESSQRKQKIPLMRT